MATNKPCSAKYPHRRLWFGVRVLQLGNERARNWWAGRVEHFDDGWRFIRWSCHAQSDCRQVSTKLHLNLKLTEVSAWSTPHSKWSLTVTRLTLDQVTKVYKRLTYPSRFNSIQFRWRFNEWGCYLWLAWLDWRDRRKRRLWRQSWPATGHTRARTTCSNGATNHIAVRASSRRLQQFIDTHLTQLIMSRHFVVLCSIEINGPLINEVVSDIINLLQSSQRLNVGFFEKYNVDLRYIWWSE